MYQELVKLNDLIQKHQLSVEFNEIKRGNLLEVIFRTGRSQWLLFIEDECGDFDINNQSLCAYLVLKSLDDYKGLSDFLAWTNFYYLKANDGFWLQYYRDLAGIVREIENEIGVIDPFINGMDYELRSGAFDALVRLVR